MITSNLVNLRAYENDQRGLPDSKFGAQRCHQPKVLKGRPVTRSPSVDCSLPASRLADASFPRLLGTGIALVDQRPRRWKSFLRNIEEALNSSINFKPSVPGVYLVGRFSQELCRRFFRRSPAFSPRGPVTSSLELFLLLDLAQKQSKPGLTWLVQRGCLQTNSEYSSRNPAIEAIAYGPGL